MARILVFTTDLPYFPGKNGHDFFNLRHLATRHEVTVVSPVYEFALPEGVRNLECSVQCVLAWPRPVSAIPLFISEDASGSLPGWIHRIPSGFRWWVLRRMLAIHRAPRDAYERLAIQSNCAPYILKALDQGAWHAFVLIQSNLLPCLNFLPGPGARFIYFHDVRSDYLARQHSIDSRGPTRSEVHAVKRQETEACQSAEVAGFVSELDQERALKLLRPTIATGVAPIPIDTGYFTPAPEGWPSPITPTVLFTGHLSHPPNVDAIRYFIAQIWPAILAAIPSARFVVAGMLPAEELRELAATTMNFELHSNVPDIRPFFWNARAYVVPMRFGGGVRQKIFEAWSMKVPVVCTTMGAEGITARHGSNCWLEDEPATFASRVVGLLRSPHETEAGIAAKKQVEANHSISAAAGRFAELAERAISIKRRKPFRLLFDLRWMKIGASGGTEQMTHELVAALSQLDHKNAYRLYCPRSTFHEWQFPAEFNVQPVFSDPTEKATERLNAAISNRLAEGLGAPPILTPPMRTLGALRKMDFDLVHSMVGYINPDLAAFPHVLTALDLQHVHYPEFFSVHEWNERDRLYRESASRAKHIICISEYTRQEMNRHYGVPLEKMSTVWVIPSRLAWRALPEAQRTKLLSGLGIGGPFLFFPAHCWLHKNHARLVEAFALILPHIPREMKLIFSGRPFPHDHPARGLIEKLGLEGRIVHLGYRSPLEIQALFQGCFLTVFPSLFEGFGMPVAEAIIAGKPVACSNRTSLPEIAGDAALTFDPTNIHDIGGRLLEIINDPRRHAALVEASRRRRPLFSTRLSAIKTLAIYQRVYEEIYA